MDRTIRILLQPKSDQKSLLEGTSVQFTQVFNAVCAYGWQNNEKNGVKLHHATYYDMREKYPNLGSNVLIQARI